MSAVRGWAIAGLVAAALAGGGWYAKAHSGGGAAPARGPAAGDRAVPVATAVVAVRDVPIYLEGLGNVAAFATVTVKSQVEGRLERVAFKEGQLVHKGDLLAQVDPRPFLIQLHTAEAALARDSAQLGTVASISNAPRRSGSRASSLSSKWTTSRRRSIRSKLPSGSRPRPGRKRAA